MLLATSVPAAAVFVGGVQAGEKPGEFTPATACEGEKRLFPLDKDIDFQVALIQGRGAERCSGLYPKIRHNLINEGVAFAAPVENTTVLTDCVEQTEQVKAMLEGGRTALLTNSLGTEIALHTMDRMSDKQLSEKIEGAVFVTGRGDSEGADSAIKGCYWPKNWQRLSQVLNNKVLFLRAEKDPVIPEWKTEQTASRLGARVRVIPGTSHLADASYADVVWEAFKSFILDPAKMRKINIFPPFGPFRFV